jgi:hypothetical protein
MKPAELRQRVEGYLRSDRRVEDLDRIFLALRDGSHGHPEIREVGDFVAHRDRRERGPVTEAVRNIHLSLDSWLHQGEGRLPDLAKAKRICAANLRTATDEQLNARLGLRHEVVKSVLTQVVRKMEAGRSTKVTRREEAVFNYLAGAFIWNPAFTDEQVGDALATVLMKAGALRPEEQEAFEANLTFLALYVTALMHGSTVVMDDGSRFDLSAGFDNDARRIEVKARIELVGWGKRVTAPVCIFWTKLIGSDDLAVAPANWPGAIEIVPSGRLAVFA